VFVIEGPKKPHPEEPWNGLEGLVTAEQVLRGSLRSYLNMRVN
jgi:hypothetical protein